MIRFLALICFLSQISIAQTTYTLEALSLDIPEGWSLHQELKDEDVVGFGFSKKNSDDYFQIFSTSNPDQHHLDLSSIKTSQTHSSTFGNLNWERLAFTQKLPKENESRIYYWSVFKSTYGDTTYYGFAKSQHESKAREHVESFLSRTTTSARNTGVKRSLTGPDYTGKKYYIGFGDHLSGFMGNEVKYDIKHTHDIFTDEIGGDYIGVKIVGPGQGATRLREEWQNLHDIMTWNDMFVQYSSGHGHHTGLAFGVSYNEIRDNALSYPAKEVIIFLMACHSGGIVKSFDQKKSQWENWPSMGRTLMVMASSKHTELSSTGPITDPEEPGGPSGSAGSAFGHALWKALIGHADGHGGGAKDGFISLGEIIDYSTWKTKNMAGHTPVHTGAFSRDLIMNRVPSQEALKHLLKMSSEGLSDSEILKRIRELDRATRIRK